jgi:hypothetical protein
LDIGSLRRGGEPTASASRPQVKDRLHRREEGISLRRRREFHPAIAGYRTSTGDPLILGGACGVLLAVAVAANYLPARRAAKLEPAIGLRPE